MPDEERIVAIAFLSISDLDRLGETLGRIHRIDEAPAFNELLSAIDVADRKLQAEQAEVPVPTQKC